MRTEPCAVFAAILPQPASRAKSQLRDPAPSSEAVHRPQDAGRRPPAHFGPHQGLSSSGPVRVIAIGSTTNDPRWLGVPPPLAAQGGPSAFSCPLVHGLGGLRRMSKGRS